MKERAALAEAGVVAVAVLMEQRTGQVIGEPEIASRGFIYQPEFGSILENAAKVLLEDLRQSRPMGRGAIANRIRSCLARYFNEQTGRNPVILPLVLTCPA